MTSRDWLTLRRAFERVLDAPPEERERLVLELARGDSEFETELRALLARDGEHGGILDDLAQRGIAEIAGIEGSAREVPLREGLRIGRFELVAPLGSGGMGTVWSAKQTAPERTVALKLLGSVRWSSAERWRFEHEARVLATLQHPNIAHLYEAGVERIGGGELLWFAMELVESARDVIQYADSRGLDRAARLALFDSLCDAVQYGHRRGVIHRDIKPANVLVDRDGRLKLIDFGVARATESSSAAAPSRTQTGELVGTLHYMAPEQLKGSPSEIDARCDVYALGVVLYRLLTGAMPFDFADASLPEIARRILEEDPAIPSRRASQLPVDFDWILLKALEKNPARRYGSVAELVEDLRRVRASEPIAARPPSSVDRLRKFVRRNRVWVAIGAAVFIGLVLAIGGVSAGLARAREGELKARLAGNESRRQAQLAAQAAQRATDERNRAQREAERNRRVIEVVDGLFEGVDDTLEGRQVKVADLLDAKVLDIDSALTVDPSLELSVRAVLGRMYGRVRSYAASRAQLERALDAFAHSEKTASDRARAQSARAWLGRALTHLGAADEGERAMREANRDARASLDERSEAATLDELMSYLDAKGAYEELLCQADEYRVLAERVDPALSVRAQKFRAAALRGLHQSADAVPILEGLWRSRVRDFGEFDTIAVDLYFDYVGAMHEAGELDLAESLYPHLIALAEYVRGPTHVETLTALNNFALLAIARGDVSGSVARLGDIVAAYDASGAPPSVEHLLAINNYGMALLQIGRYADAEPQLRRGAESAAQFLAEDDINAMQFRFNHGACLAWMKRWSESEPILLDTFERIRGLVGADNALLAKCIRTIAAAYHVNGQEDVAASWRARYPFAFAK